MWRMSLNSKIVGSPGFPLFANYTDSGGVTSGRGSCGSISLSSTGSTIWLPCEVPQKGQIFVKDLNSDGISDIFTIDYEKGRITLYLSELIQEKGAY